MPILIQINFRGRKVYITLCPVSKVEVQTKAATFFEVKTGQKNSLNRSHFCMSHFTCLRVFPGSPLVSPCLFCTSSNSKKTKSVTLKCVFIFFNYPFNKKNSFVYVIFDVILYFVRAHNNDHSVLDGCTLNKYCYTKKIIYKINPLMKNLLNSQ